ncbi:hypothetical protein DACRYDRAFT_24037 [Dacryopinax primogenitus]|uniref:Uncharacterized protein n=1 Tax=Dacryopinax primogenitus (strain DJM 731) TaxID=1858805 RepID=M5FZC9_DACPD|nr:uncharacterized protein DACRYDRAFT_24037 [Dacryopinax primogenitus]EJT98926.1 hypothetical protein DACRYDRAFT_24037 [Dacryopinax primogenitus]
MALDERRQPRKPKISRTMVAFPTIQYSRHVSTRQEVKNRGDSVFPTLTQCAGTVRSAG